jgi:hypothetical protein
MTDTTITVQYQIHADDQHSRGEIQLPRGAAGDPQMAVALYFFGERTSVGFVTKAEIVPEWECAICGSGSNSRAAGHEHVRDDEYQSETDLRRAER